MIRKWQGTTWQGWEWQYALPGTNKIITASYRRRKDDFHDRMLTLGLMDKS